MGISGASSYSSLLPPSYIGVLSLTPSLIIGRALMSDDGMYCAPVACLCTCICDDGQFWIPLFLLCPKVGPQCTSVLSPTPWGDGSSGFLSVIRGCAFWNPHSACKLDFLFLSVHLYPSRHVYFQAPAARSLPCSAA